MNAQEADLPMLRHTVATLAYRAGKAVRGAPGGFGEFRTGEGGRTAVQILAHMGDLFDWALTMADGEAVWKDAVPLPWNGEVARFFTVLERFDARLQAGRPLANPATKIFAGPVADALTHTGQIAMMRRMAGAKIRGESYFRAEIVTGRVGLEQAPPRREFD
ncbi:MAG TPA: hypothetical protein VF554_04100 [Thermoanaerobaculia bacterium]